MKKIFITESEKESILKQHKISINEELTTYEMLQKIQSAIGTNPDAIIGPDTSEKLVSLLNSDTFKQPEKIFDFSCVKNHNNREVILYDWRMARPDYQLGDLLFQDDGTYYDLNQPNTPLTYTCSGDVIKTSNHKDIQKDENLFNKITEPVKPIEPIKIDTLSVNRIDTTQIKSPEDGIVKEPIEDKKLEREKKRKKREEIANSRKQIREKIRQMKKEG